MATNIQEVTWQFMVEDEQGMRVPLDLAGNGSTPTFHSSDAAWNERYVGPAAEYGQTINAKDGRRVILVRSDQYQPIASWPATTK